MQQMAFVPHIVVILPPGGKEFALVHWDFYFDLPIGTLHLTAPRREPGDFLGIHRFCS